MTPSIPATIQEYPVDLTTALRLAEAENPLIAEARQRITEALAERQGARSLLLPSLNIGMNLHTHSGDLQRSSGRILSLNESSLYFGGGAGATAAGTLEVPAVNLYSQVTDAIFEPLAANQRLEGTRFRANATANQILLEVAELHFESLAAEATLLARKETVNQGQQVAQLTRSYADAGQGRDADAERASTLLSLSEVEVRRAEEEVAVAAARLARRLHLDQSVRLRPLAPNVETITLIDPGIPLPSLIATAIQRRPEVIALSNEINAAEIKHRQEIYRPLLPTVALGMSGGAFGGGSNLAPPLMSHFAGRTDFDVRVYWTAENLGFGNSSMQKRRWAQVGQAVSDRSTQIALVRTEVTAALAEVDATRRQIGVTTRQLKSAESGFREDLLRIRNTVGRPIEVVNSLELLNTARVARIRALTEFNKAQFRLFVALGSPPPLSDSANAPLPPAPIASPPLPPLL
jgi:outer membrane protein TolC